MSSPVPARVERTVDITPTVCLNFDFELLFGFRHFPDAEFAAKREAMRDVKERIHLLIDLLERYDIACTWNTVGHLFLSSCDGHPDAPGGGIARDPATSVNEDPLWYAPDIVSRLRDSRTNFEIGCHSFSHRIFTDSTPDEVRYEIETARRIADGQDLDLRSFVFPRNLEAHHEQLANAGYECYRVRRYHDLGLMHKVRRAVDIAIGRDWGRPHSPAIDEYGLVRIHPSMLLGRYAEEERTSINVLRHSPFHLEATECLRQGLLQTTTEGGVFQIWSHPEDFQETIATGDLEQYLRIIREFVDDNRVALRTMSEVAQTARESDRHGGDT